LLVELIADQSITIQDTSTHITHQTIPVIQETNSNQQNVRNSPQEVHKK
jgi:hypothetical protein